LSVSNSDDYINDRLGWSSSHSSDRYHNSSFANSAVSSSATAHRPLILLRQDKNRKQYDTSSQFDFLSLSTSQSTPETKERKNGITLRNSLDSLSSRKSVFVGAGLGLRQNLVPEFNPQGSTKSVLRKIVKNVEYESEGIGE
jgi:hypothetical protein